jgi:hypothetical protein
MSRWLVSNVLDSLSLRLNSPSAPVKWPLRISQGKDSIGQAKGRKKRGEGWFRDEFLSLVFLLSTDSCLLSLLRMCVMFFQKVVDVYIVRILAGRKRRQNSRKHNGLAVPDRTGAVLAYTYIDLGT